MSPGGSCSHAPRSPQECGSAPAVPSAAASVGCLCPRGEGDISPSCPPQRVPSGALCAACHSQSSVLSCVCACARSLSPGGDRPFVPGGPSLRVSRKVQGPGGVLTARMDCASPTWGPPGAEADSGRASAVLEAASLRTPGTSVGQFLRSPRSRPGRAWGWDRGASRLLPPGGWGWPWAEWPL